MATTPFSNEQMLQWLGPINQHKDNQSGDPIKMQYRHFSKFKVLGPGEPHHGWQEGVHASPYPDDRNFVLKVCSCGAVFRMSNLTPSYLLGHIPLSSQAVQFMAILILGFSHEHYPRLAVDILDRMAVWIPPARVDKNGNPIPESSNIDWTAAVESCVTAVATSQAGFSRPCAFRKCSSTTCCHCNLRSYNFKKVCSAFIAGFVEKIDPEVSLHYMVDDDLSITSTNPHWIGKVTNWSQGRKVPYLDQQQQERNVQDLLRNLKIPRPVNNTDMSLPGPALGLILSFAFGPGATEEAVAVDVEDYDWLPRPAKIARTSTS